MSKVFCVNGSVYAQLGWPEDLRDTNLELAEVIWKLNTIYFLQFIEVMQNIENQRNIVY